MITIQDIKNNLKHYDIRDIQRATKSWDVRYINIDDSQYPIIRLRAQVEGRFYYMVRLDIRFDDYQKTVISRYGGKFSPCDFTSLNYEELCLLYCFIEQRELGNVSTSQMHSFHTSSALSALIKGDTTRDLIPDTSREIFLNAVIDESRDSMHHMVVDFHIGRSGQRTYIVQNIHTLCNQVQLHQKVHFGKALEFIPSLDSFDHVSRNIMEFLMRLDGGKDQYTTDNYGGYEQSFITRYLHLRGTYLDEFLSMVDGDHLYYGSDQKRNAIYQIEGKTNLRAKLVPLEDDYAFSMDVPNYYEGEKYLYELDLVNNTLVKVEKQTELLELMESYQSSSDTTLYLSKEDIPAFSTNLYPKLKENANVEVVGFLPEAYMPPMPTFQIYLDYPQEDVVTCELRSVYEDGTYNVLKGFLEEPEKRNIQEEKKMDHTIFSWFTSFDSDNYRMVCANDDEKIYMLLTEGIPFFQSIADVYVSDKLKKLNATTLNRVNVGISVKHDLLQLQLIEDQKTLDELAEILSRYEPKKKFYKLKNGNIIKVDPQNVESIANVVDDLQLSNKEIKSGEIEVPKYRAMYLDSLDNEELDVERDQRFTQLINQVHDIENTEYEIPQSLNDILRDYQKDGYRWLKALQMNGFGGLLADEMGLGKSVQIIALILSMENRGRVLIVCPASLVYNWSNEFRKFAPELKTTMLAGNATDRQYTIANSEEDAIFITSYDALKRDIDIYHRMHFDVEVIDEAQYIKNAGTLAAGAVKEIDAAFKVALTGTPIENRLSELWSIFDYMMPGYLYTYTKFKRLYESPIVKKQNTLMQEKLRKMILPFILRRRKKDVLKDLPEKLEEVMYAPLDGEQKDLYQARTQRLKTMLQRQTQKEFNENKIAVLAEITKLRQTCCAPSLIYNSYKGNSNKEDLCINLVERAIEEGHKILLFSQFKSMLQILTTRFEEEGIRYHILTGETTKENRAKMVEAFQNDDVPVFCISLKAGGTGLNLTAADIVIHYDPWWNTAVENQATDRAHRIGQDKVVSVYRLIMKDTIEERIIELQATKANLEKEILSGEEIADSTLTKEQLMEILE